MGLSVSLLVLDASGLGIPVRIRAMASDIVAPLLDILERPIRGTQAGLERLAGVSDIYLENEKLRKENEMMREWRDAALKLTRENDELRDLLDAPGRTVPTVATGRVIGVGGGAFERNVVLNVGTGDGVALNLPVVDATGVVGRTIQVGRLSSRVLLVTDINSRIPVRLEDSGALAIIEGQNSRELRLNYVPMGTEIKVGSRVLTSGHGGIFPPDLPIGRIVEVREDAVIVEPESLLDRLDFVKVLAYVPLTPETEPEPLVPLEKAPATEPEATE
ncbi:rod shape-determining protein MreC [Gimibacter soli]|uniref:Cell shape-determining protein MreC n=1 Tax=Gimibacter soli TaxID=3024400 RepID=A0AAF0BGI8_9PROT|nr:rod shape-determining protein MreC [Gimibacter soli]WCL53548.1 rod shape-determining protein MreC [Gimibacter soli]